MMSSQLLSSAVSLLGLWILFHWFYRRYRVDLLRERLFTLRGELFDMAASKEIAFDDRAYKLMRATLNGFLAASPRVGFLSISLNSRRFSLEDGGEVVDFRKEWELAVSSISGPAEGKLDEMIDRMDFFIIDHVIMASLVLIATIVPCLAWIFIHRFGQQIALRCKRGMSGWFDKINSAAMTTGMNSATPMTPG